MICYVLPNVVINPPFTITNYTTTAGSAYYVLHPKKGITICNFLILTRPSKPKESFFGQILSDLKDLTLFSGKNIK